MEGEGRTGGIDGRGAVGGGLGVGRGWRKCGTSNSPGLPLPSSHPLSPLTSALATSTLRSQTALFASFNPFYSQRRSRRTPPMTIRRRAIPIPSVLSFPRYYSRLLLVAYRLAVFRVSLIGKVIGRCFGHVLLAG